VTDIASIDNGFRRSQMVVPVAVRASDLLVQGAPSGRTTTVRVLSEDTSLTCTTAAGRSHCGSAQAAPFPAWTRIALSITIATGAGTTGSLGLAVPWRARPVARAPGRIRPVRISARADYAVRAAVELAAHEGGLLKGEAIARAQEIPPKFLENILGDLRLAGLVRSQRGAEGGYRLSRPASEIAVADVIRAVDGPLASVRGGPPEEVAYAGTAEALKEVWIAVRANLRAVLERTTLADIASGALPAEVSALARDPEAWTTR
jgi:Rrf2 family protein